MKRNLLALAILALSLPAWQGAKGVDVSVDFFYNNLSGGSWMEVGDYGYCWQPDVVVSNTSWRPYSDGYWAYTDLGWTWVSYEDFGWATYHYGRWVRLSDYGWVWVPGRDEDLEWGPAWVSWRTGGDYVGWAPLPPSRVRFYDGGVISGHVDIDFDIGPAYYNFVDVRYIGEPVLRERIVNVNQNITYINQTVNVTNITYKNKVVYNYGPDINTINARASRPIQRLKLERQENVDVTSAAKSGALTKVQGDKLVVGAPMTIKKSTKQIAPPAVKAKVAQAKADRGWSAVGDENAQKEFKQKLRGQDLQKVPPAGGAAGAGAQAGAGASPAGASGASPAPGVGTTASPATAGAASTDQLERGRGKRQKGGAEQAGSPVESSGAAASSGELASPTEATGARERGKHKGRRDEELRQGVSPAGAIAPSGAESAAEATGARERGKHKGRRGEELQQGASPAGAIAPSGPESPAETTMPQGGRHRGHEGRQRGPAESGNAPAGAPTASPQDMSQTGGSRRRDESANAPGESGRGRHGGGGPEEAAAPGGGRQDLQGQGQGGRQRGPGAQPGGAPASAETQQGHGPRGRGKQRPEASPAASPSP